MFLAYKQIEGNVWNIVEYAYGALVSAGKSLYFN